MSPTNPAAQPIETSHYTYAAHRPAALATRNLINQDPTQHSPTSPCGPTTHNNPHDNHQEEHPPDHHAKEPSPTPAEHQHPHLHPHHHHQRHPTHHPSASSPTNSSIGSDSIQFPLHEFDREGEVETEISQPQPQRRQSWNLDDLKRSVMEGLLEKGKGKQAKGGYSSTSS